MPFPATLFLLPSPAPDIEPDKLGGFTLSPRFTFVPLGGFIDCLRHEADFSRQGHSRWSVVAPIIESICANR